MAEKFGFNGASLIGGSEVVAGNPFQAVAAASGQPLPGDFSNAGADEVRAAASLADEAFDDFANSSPESRAALLEAIADSIEAIGPALIERAMAESGLPEARLTGERGRTCGQLRLFATELRRGEFADVRVDTALPDRQPLPRPDLRQRRVAVGPVAVFGASNFPLAFSVAGGDTASALAAGCPALVKSHPAHPGTGELVARAISAAVKASDFAPGIFSFLQGDSRELGAALVADPAVKAVGFTGSRAGGLALLKIAQGRPEPIPVYAEMSSVNPVILLDHALDARGEDLGRAFVGSLTMGAGQFCTNPGLLFARLGDALSRFLASASEALAAAPAQTMLTAGIGEAYCVGVRRIEQHSQVEPVARGLADGGRAQAALFATDAAAFLAHPELSEEIFGAVSLLVSFDSDEQLLDLLRHVEGQLTITLQLDDGDLPLARRLMPLLERKAGRILANGWPTGVEVSTAMVHGGPFPATSDVRSTSVGTAAMERFLRPVCYQNLPADLLPEAVRDENAWNLPRTVDMAR
ncbi:aldehyde dehydrogenase (NADP(+)) [Sphingomonas rhizophila]|uniref:Aldehyde dehydrogenase (NADP(+)) n=1 Tax=Sphingomonas rhizophila TaxID=2071607 RepID=A0A7G9SBA8_9SPHN|nr:aldehyde dehydrogenase (NADP(+)) [Sphingomonas rhizophila]QNN65133.1 aldehyde dehydrogenase (NADP(+)) [Sphingomonas rhizophila]